MAQATRGGDYGPDYFGCRLVPAETQKVFETLFTQRFIMFFACLDHSIGVENQRVSRH